MKKLQLVMAALLLIASSTTAIAQDQPQPQRQGGGNQVAALMQGITLTADQQAKVDSISKKVQADMQAMRQDQSIDQDARRAKGREMRTKMNDEIKALLTDEQKKVFDKNVADMQARMQQ